MPRRSTVRKGATCDWPGIGISGRPARRKTANERAVRRAGRAPQPVAPLEAEGIRLIPTAREVRVGGELVPTTTFEYDILEYLVRAAGRIVGRDELTAALYHRRSTPFDRAIDVHVSRLRKKLGPLGSAVRTVRGAGYLFRSGPDDEGATPR